MLPRPRASLPNCRDPTLATGMGGDRLCRPPETWSAPQAIRFVRSVPVPGGTFGEQRGWSFVPRKRTRGGVRSRAGLGSGVSATVPLGPCVLSLGATFSLRAGPPAPRPARGLLCASVPSHGAVCFLPQRTHLGSSRASSGPSWWRWPGPSRALSPTRRRSFASKKTVRFLRPLPSLPALLT